MWDSETDVYPYVYFDEGRWLVGQPSRLAGLLLGHGWTEDAAASPMFTMMIMDYVWPESVSGLRSRFDLTAPLGQILSEVRVLTESQGTDRP